MQDALELSDDSDVEVHPNVDKRSFIRAKQNQIHQERYHRRQQITTLKYERIINDGLLSRVNRLLDALEAGGSKSSENVDEQIFQALLNITGDPTDDSFPPRPEGVHAREPESPTYSKMLATLVDQVKKDVDGSNTDDRFKEYVQALKKHQTKIRDLQKDLQSKLDELEREEARKITSDSIHTGFDSSFVSKSDKKTSSQKKASSTTAETVEVLNPGALNKAQSSGAGGVSSGTEAKAVAGDKDDDEHIEPSDLGKAFGRIKLGDYRACLQFISENPAVVAERETDGLLVEAFNRALEGQDDNARQCVHQALLLQYCRSLGRDGVGLFFKRFVFHPPWKRRFPSLTMHSVESPPRTIKLKRSLWTMLTRHMPAFVPAPRRSPPSGPTLAKPAAWNRYNCTPSNQAQPSTSPFHPLTARMKRRSRRERSSKVSRPPCKEPWSPAA